MTSCPFISTGSRGGGGEGGGEGGGGGVLHGYSKSVWTLLHIL